MDEIEGFMAVEASPAVERIRLALFQTLQDLNPQVKDGVAAMFMLILGTLQDAPLETQQNTLESSLIDVAAGVFETAGCKLTILSGPKGKQ